MSRYIDADDVLEVLTLMYDNQADKDEPYNVGVMGAINYIKHRAPSIDICFCKECISADEKPIADGRFWCNSHGCYMRFCSDGEREGE